MGVEHCFESGTVVPDLQSRDKESALCELIRRAPVFRDLSNLDSIADAVLCREREQSTGFGHGVAVAHGRAQRLDRVLIALGLSKEGIPYGAADGEPVHLLFVIVSPPGPTIDYLQALSCLVRAIRKPEVRRALLAAAQGPEMERLMREAFLLNVDRVLCKQAG